MRAGYRHYHGGNQTPKASPCLRLHIARRQKMASAYCAAKHQDAGGQKTRLWYAGSSNRCQSMHNTHVWFDLPLAAEVGWSLVGCTTEPSDDYCASLAVILPSMPCTTLAMCMHSIQQKQVCIENGWKNTRNRRGVGHQQQGNNACGPSQQAHGVG